MAHVRRTGVSLASCLLLAGAAGLAQPPDELTLVSPVDRFALPLVRSTPGDQEFVRLTDLVGLFDLGVPEQARPDTITITNGARALILTADQRVVSVAGRLISLRSSAPRREDGGWLVPVEFLSRALGPLIEQTISLRPDSRLVLIGDVAVPSVSGRTRTQGTDAYLEFDVRPSTPHQVTRQGQQLVVAFDADALDIGRLPAPHGNLLSGIRADAARNRIVLDLGPAFQSFEVTSRSIQRGEQVSIALRADRPARAAVDPAPAASGRPLPDLNAAAAIRVVAIDAGHGGADEGVVGSGEIREKDITLSVAQRLHDAIVERLGLRVILTRDVDRTVSLDERAAVANTNRADLLISLHVNASVRPWARGAEVFFLRMGEDGRQAQAAVEHDARVVGVVGGGPARDCARAVGIGADPPPRGIGRARRHRPSGTRPASAHESTRGAGSPVPGAGRRQHAGGRRGTGFHLEPRGRRASGKRTLSGGGGRGAGCEHPAVRGPCAYRGRSSRR